MGRASERLHTASSASLHYPEFTNGETVALKVRDSLWGYFASLGNHCVLFSHWSWKDRFHRWWISETASPLHTPVASVRPNPLGLLPVTSSSGWTRSTLEPRCAPLCPLSPPAWPRSAHLLHLFQQAEQRGFACPSASASGVICWSRQATVLPPWVVSCLPWLQPPSSLRSQSPKKHLCRCHSPTNRATLRQSVPHNPAEVSQDFHHHTRPRKRREEPGLWIFANLVSSPTRPPPSLPPSQVSASAK